MTSIPLFSDVPFLFITMFISVILFQGAITGVAFAEVEKGRLRAGGMVEVGQDSAASCIVVHPSLPHFLVGHRTGDLFILSGKKPGESDDDYDEEEEEDGEEGRRKEENQERKLPEITPEKRRIITAEAELE